MPKAVPKYGNVKYIIFECMFNADEIKILPTSDGSNTLFLVGMNETYHSRFGALREAMHVYFKNGLAFWVKQNTAQSIRVFELGFGTGLNAWLAGEFAEIWGGRIDYISVEKFPVDAEILTQLELGFDSNWFLWDEIYPVKTLVLDRLMRRQLWKYMVLQPYDGLDGILGIKSDNSKRFSIQKLQGDAVDYFAQYSGANKGFDVVFWDAFAPKKQPELWTEELFCSVIKAMNPGGILVTYTANSEVRRRLIRGGFEVDKPAGPPGKREMLRATKPKLL